MKQALKQQIIDEINRWNDADIYVVSLFVYDEDDDPARPTVTLGYNTEAQVQNEMARYGTDAEEARWNYACWLQNTCFCFGTGESRAIVKQWLQENGIFAAAATSKAAFEPEALSPVTRAFVNVLIEIVREIHAEKVLPKKFGKELPILIHELEYYDEIARQNIEANGELLDAAFVHFCTGEDEL